MSEEQTGLYEIMTRGIEADGHTLTGGSFWEHSGRQLSGCLERDAPASRSRKCDRPVLMSLSRHGLASGAASIIIIVHHTRRQTSHLENLCEETTISD